MTLSHQTSNNSHENPQTRPIPPSNTFTITLLLPLHKGTSHHHRKHSNHIGKLPTLCAGSVKSDLSENGRNSNDSAKISYTISHYNELKRYHRR
eukprot:scaffold118126_cov56-Attheya_sp.AAC.7